MSIAGGWHLYGFPPGEILFLDLHFILSAWECSRQGFDVVSSNPCDIMRREFIYPPAWLIFAPIPVGTDGALWIGIVVTVSYLVTAAIVLRPYDAKTFLIGLALLLSPSTMYVVERCNVDALFFLVTVFVVWLTFAPSLMRSVLANALVGTSVALKIYPLALLPVTIPQWAKDRRSTIVVASILAAFGIIYLFIQWDEISRFATGVPSQPTLAMFGGALLPWAWELVSDVELPEVFKGKIFVVVMFAGLCVLIDQYCKPSLDHEQADTINARLFVCGGLVLAFCFLVTINVSYRLIFVILTVPYLLEIVRHGQSKRVCWLASISLIWCLWSSWNMTIIIHFMKYFYSLHDLYEK
jgi:hypothetical protein